MAIVPLIDCDDGANGYEKCQIRMGRWAASKTHRSFDRVESFVRHRHAKANGLASFQQLSALLVLPVAPSSQPRSGFKRSLAGIPAAARRARVAKRGWWLRQSPNVAARFSNRGTQASRKSMALFYAILPCIITKQRTGIQLTAVTRPPAHFRPHFPKGPTAQFPSMFVSRLSGPD